VDYKTVVALERALRVNRNTDKYRQGKKNLKGKSATLRKNLGRKGAATTQSRKGNKSVANLKKREEIGVGLFGYQQRSLMSETPGWNQNEQRLPSCHWGRGKRR